MEHIIVNEYPKFTQSMGKKNLSVLNDVVFGEHFNSFVESQKIGLKPNGTYKHKGLTSLGAATLREETEHILAHCNPHYAVNSLETTHLVVGYVQSGKTMSFTALTALALDNCYRMVVYLAGSKTNLMEQTTKRLKKDLIAENDKNRDFYKIHKDPKNEDLNQILGNLYLGNNIILIPVLKHYKHIQNLTSIFKSPEFKEIMKDETVLIIDDEADQVSLNSYGRKNSKKAEDEEDEKSKTYDAIMKMRFALPGNSYIQYTATPQANVLISMKDMLSPKSHTLLTPGEGYIGGLLYFGRGNNHDLYNGRLIMTIPDKEVFHKKKNNLTRIPKSLKDALMLHILAVIIVIKYLHKDGIRFLSMMVHPAIEKIYNSKFKKWIENELNLWRKIILKEDGNDDKQDLLERFRELFSESVKLYKDNEIPKYEQIEPFIKKVLCNWKVYLVNTDKDAQTEIEWDNYEMHILVGAEMLNRGFTIENLATTYMPRYSVGPANADTIQQRCRFFGYKRDYIESCRVFLPKCSIIDYLNYIQHEEELRSALRSCDTLAAAEHKILLDPSLKATRSNVLPISIVKSKLRGMREMQAFESKERIIENKKLCENFINNHINDFDPDLLFSYGTDDRSHRCLKLSVQDAISFLDDFQFGNYKDATLKAATIRYLRYLYEKKINNLKYVYFIQMAFKREQASLRERDFDTENLKIKGSQYGAGMDPKGKEFYPGDHLIVKEDSITIQLHHFKLKGVHMGFPQDAYTLAIYFPETLATNYVLSEQNNQEDDYPEDEENM